MVAEDFTSELRDRKEDKPMTIEERLKSEADLAKEIADAFEETVKTFDWSTIEIGVIDRSKFRLEQAQTIDFMKVVMDKCGFHDLRSDDFAHDPLNSRIERAFRILTSVSDYKKGYLYQYVVVESDKNQDWPGWVLVFDINR